MDEETAPDDKDNGRIYSIGNNPIFIEDIENDIREGVVTNVKNYVEVRNLIYNLVLYILANSDDEKCKAYIREEFCPVFKLYLDEIDESDKSKLIRFFRDYNQAFEDVCKTRSIPDRSIFESRYNRFRQYALAIIHDPKNIYSAPNANLITEDKKLTIRQIALKLAYEGIYVNKTNADLIIKEYGHTSGSKLFQEYLTVKTHQKRISDPDLTLKSLTNKIEVFEIVIEILADEFKAKAIDEVKTLKSYITRYKQTKK